MSEVIAGKAGNDIVSGFIAMREKLVEHYPNYSDLVVWSDSCVPQNRNSPVIDFITPHQHIDSITMKYSVRGHGCVQEVDNMHKKIDDAMKVREFYSPLSFLSVLLQTDRKKSLSCYPNARQEHHFKDYKNCSKMLKYNKVKSFQVRQLRFERQDPYTIKFNFSHSDESFFSTNIGTHSKNTKTRNGKQPTVKFLTPRIQKVEKCLNQSKIDDLVSMLDYMPLVDRVYYRTL